MILQGVIEMRKDANQESKEPKTTTNQEARSPMKIIGESVEDALNELFADFGAGKLTQSN